MLAVVLKGLHKVEGLGSQIPERVYIGDYAGKYHRALLI